MEFDNLDNFCGRAGNLVMELGNFDDLMVELGNLVMALANFDDLAVELGNLIGWGKDFVKLRGRFWIVNFFEHYDRHAVPALCL